MLDYVLRGKIAVKFPLIRSVCYKYMTIDQIIDYERSLEGQKHGAYIGYRGS
jgi:hypothetical protein